MAILKVTIDDNDLQQALREALSKAHDLQPVLIAASQRLVFSVQQNFRAGGRPTRWVPSRRAIEQGGQTLVNTARLQNSITPRIQGNSVTIGTNVIYARIHQEGGTIATPAITPRRRKALRFQAGGRAVFARRTRAHLTRIPARPFLLVQESDTTYIQGILQEYLEQPLRGA